MSIVCGIKLDTDHVFVPKQNTIHIGKRFETKNFGWAEVIDGDFSHLRIRFDNTGNERVLGKNCVFNKNAKDLYAPFIAGVAAIGNVKKSLHLKEYKMWHHMIERCYNPREPYYPSYGGAGVTVSERWLVFEYFLEDYEKIEKVHPPNYKGLLELDKDFKQFDTPLNNRIYSLETCALVSKEVNQICRGPSLFFNAYHENGIVEKNCNVNWFIRKYPNTKRTGIQNCMNPKKPLATYKGWKFERVEATKEVVWELIRKINGTEE